MDRGGRDLVKEYEPTDPRGMFSIRYNNNAQVKEILHERRVELAFEHQPTRRTSSIR